MTPLVQTFTDILSFGTLLGDLFAVFLLFILITPKKEESFFARHAAKFFEKYAILFSGIIAITAMLSSLFYSEIAGFVPCVLCWWERIFLYPQAFVLAAAAFVKDKHIRAFCFTFSVIGIVISGYHSYLQYGGSPLVACSAIGAGPSCAFRYFIEFGYITIPMMAFTTFALIILLMLFKKKHA